jgi:hypothetical protein
VAIAVAAIAPAVAAHIAAIVAVAGIAPAAIAVAHGHHDSRPTPRCGAGVVPPEPLPAWSGRLS